MNHRFVPGVLTGLVLALLNPATAARVIDVAPDGPVTIQEALDQAQPGDTVRLAPGIYRERIRFPRSGEHGKPITVEGRDGAVIDGRRETELAWAPAFDIAPGLYRAAVDWRPYFFTADGKTLTQLHYRRSRLGAAKTPWPDLFRNGPDGRTLKGIEALAMTNDDEQQIYVRFRDGRDPSTMTWALGTKRPVVLIDGADRVVLRNVAIRTGWIGVYVADSLGAVIEHCTIGPTRHGVWLAENTDRATVRFNDISAYPYAVTGPAPRHGPTQGRENWTNWLAVKRAGYWDSFGIRALRSSGGHQIHDNLVHQHWGGIEEWANAPDQNRGMKVHHNRVTDISDDALEPSGSQADGRWHDNLVINAICGFRIKHVDAGPLYAYRNIFFNCREDFRIFEGGAPGTEVYVYHNTSTAGPAVASNKVRDPARARDYHFLNNLFYCQAWWLNSSSVDPDWMSDYNVFVRRGESEGWEETRALAARLGMDANSRWVTDRGPGFEALAELNVALRADSPAIGSGADLTRLLGRALPGLEPGYFTGDAPDAGALQAGAPMPAIPRAREDVKNLPEAGYWPPADAQPRRVLEIGDRLRNDGAPNLRGDAVERWAGPPKHEPGASARIDFTSITPAGDIDPHALEPAGENLLHNGDFARVQEDGRPVGWRVTLSDQVRHQVAVDRDQQPDGIEQSLRVNILGARNGLGEVTQWVPVTPNRKYRLTGWINGSGGSVAMLQVKLRDRKELARINGPWNGKGWTPVTIDFVAENATQVGVLCRFKQNAHAQGKSAWFAHLHLGEAAE